MIANKRRIFKRIISRDYFGGGGGVCVLSSTLPAPFLVSCAPLWTTFLVPCLILRPVFLAALPVACAASLVSCFIPPLSCCAKAVKEKARVNTTGHRYFSFIRFTSVLLMRFAGGDA